MRIQDYDSVCNVKSPADIEAALRKRHGAGRNAFWLSHGTEPFPAINIMVKGEGRSRSRSLLSEREASGFCIGWQAAGPETRWRHRVFL